MIAARVTLCAAALLVCAWFGLGAFQAHRQAQASSLLQTFSTPSPARTARILVLLDDAAALNPDRSVDEMRAEALLRAGRRPAALRALSALVRAEPQNVAAWVQLALAAGRTDPRLAAHAQARVRALAPAVPAPR